MKNLLVAQLEIGSKEEKSFEVTFFCLFSEPFPPSCPFFCLFTIYCLIALFCLLLFCFTFLCIFLGVYYRLERCRVCADLTYGPLPLERLANSKLGTFRGTQCEKKNNPERDRPLSILFFIIFLTKKKTFLLSNITSHTFIISIK